MLESVTNCDGLVILMTWLAKVRLEGAMVAMGAMPVPLRLTDCGLVGSESVIVRLAASAPEICGLKVTLMVQFRPAARLEPHVFVSMKSFWPVPVMSMLVIERAVELLFVSVTLVAALVVPTSWLGKVTLSVERPTLESTITETVEVRVTLPLFAINTTG